MGNLVQLGLVSAVFLTIGAWALAARGGRLAGIPIGRGLAHGLAAATIVGAVVTLLVTIGMNGREFFFSGTLDLGEAFRLGLLAGLAVAVGFFWLGLLLMAVGLVVRPSATWSTLGAWLAVPIAVVVMAVAYAGYRSVIAQIEAPATANGTVTFDVTGVETPHASGGGPALCTTFDDGSFRLEAGGALWFEPGLGEGSTLSTDDGRPAAIQLGWETDAAAPWISISIGDRGADASTNEPSTWSLAAGSSHITGRITLHGLVARDAEGEPDPSEPWSGTVSWDCGSD